MSTRSVCSALLLCALAIAPRVASAECPVCGSEWDCKDPGVECCCKRGNKIKIIVKRQVFCMPVVAAAPVGYAVPSVAAVMTPTMAMPINMSFSPTGAAPAANNQRQPTGAGPSSAGSSTVCDDPCGEIKQLRDDVNRLIKQVDRLGGHVETLAKGYKELKDNQKTAPAQ